MYNYKLSFEGRRHLRIFDYGVYCFEINSIIKYYDMLFECFDKIASNPMMFPAARQNPLYRFCVCGVDSIFYRIDGNEIEIITIIGRCNY